MPCERSRRRRAASSSSSVTTMPPSPMGRFLFEKKLKQPIAPNVPQARPVERGPRRVRRVLDHGEPVSAASASTASMSHAKPP